MKRILTVMLAALLLFTCACAEGVVSLGMSVDEVTGACGKARLDREDAGFDALEYENVERFGYACDAEYLFSGDALIATIFEYDAEDLGVTFNELRAAVCKTYGDPLNDDDPERWRLLDEIIEGEPDDDGFDRVAYWEMPDGVLAVLSAQGDDIEFCLCDEIKTVSQFL